MEEKNGPEMARSQNAPKSAFRSKADARYWMVGKRLSFHDSANYSARLQCSGRREWFPLGTPNKKKAAAKAAEIYSFLQAQGLDATIARYKPESVAMEGPASVGALIAESCRISSARRHTLDEYAKAFRKIVSEIKGIKIANGSDRTPGALNEWRVRVDAVPLAEVTPAKVVAWKNARLRATETDPLAKRRAIVTVNSLIRNSKALFGKKILPFLKQIVPLPCPLPFEGVTLEKAPSLRYVSRIDAFAILAKAKADLVDGNPEAFKIMLLALVCGLRRSEIDNLLWRSVDFTRKVIRLESTEYHQLKSEDSAGEIDLDDDTLALFRGYRAKAPTELFVIQSPNRPRNETKARTYRCNATFKQVIDWLRAQGVDAAKPLHTLRKEIGSIIASEHGIFEASRYLRHSDIRITSAFYADKKKIVTPKTFSGLLGAGDEDEATDVHPGDDSEDRHPSSPEKSRSPNARS
jgi:integrase